MNEGAYRPFFILYQGYRWMALCVLMGRCMARASSVLKSTAQSYDFIFISARDFGEKFWNSRFCLVKICDVCGSCFLSHRFHRCTRIFLRSPDVSSHADLAFPSAADFQFADFLPFYPFKFPHGSHESHGFFYFFTFSLFYLFHFKKCIKC